MRIFNLFEQPITSAMEEIEFLGRKVADEEFQIRLEEEAIEARAAERQYEAMIERAMRAQEY